MGYETYLKELLRPLGVYAMDGIGGGELAAVGERLDACFAQLEETQREMLLATAEHGGLDAIESLLTRRPVTTELSARREALAALLRVGGDSFTLTALNDNLKGCGINAVVKERAEAQTVEVRFPDVLGVPEEFAKLREIIEDILPCHLDIRYWYRYFTWAEFERAFPMARVLDALQLTWAQLEVYAG